MSAYTLLVRQLVALLVLAGCGTPRGPVASSSTDSASAPWIGGAALLDSLPPGADRCSLVRVGLVPEARRDLAVHVSQAHRLSWLSGPVSVAAAAHQGRARREASRVLLRGPSADAIIEHLGEHSPVRLLQDPGRACPGPLCWVYRIGRVDDRTVLVQRGPWDRQPLRDWTRQGEGRAWDEAPDSDHVEPLAQCRQLAQASPNAVEVSARSNRDPLHIVADAAVPASLTMEMVGDGLHVVERWPHSSIVNAMDLLQLRQTLESREFAGLVRVRRVPSGLMAVGRVLWEDLELAEEDRRRMRRAVADEARATVPLPVERVDLLNRRELRTQIERRRAQISGDDGESERTAALRDLLERAVAAHPSDHGLAAELFDFLITPVGDANAAIQVVDQVMSESPDNPEAWRLRRRKTLAMIDTEALARSLRADGLASPRSARRGADMLARVPEPEDYEWAEAAWVAAEKIPPRRGVELPGVALPLESLFEVALLLTEDATGDLPSTAVYGIVRSEAEMAEGPSGPPMSRVFSWRSGRRSIRVGGGATDSPDHLRALAAALVRNLPPGPMSVQIALVPFDRGPEHAYAQLQLTGRLEQDHFIATRSSARWNFEAVRRYLAEPLVELESRVFPPPDIDIEFESRAEANAALSRARGEPALDCRRFGAVARCTLLPDLTVSRRALVRMLLPLLQP